MTAYERVVFMQGEDAEEALSILEEQGRDAAIDYLAEWHNCGSHEEEDAPAAGEDDYTYETEDGYLLSYNLRLGYIGLEHIHK